MDPFQSFHSFTSQPNQVSPPSSTGLTTTNLRPHEKRPSMAVMPPPESPRRPSGIRSTGRGPGSPTTPFSEQGGDEPEDHVEEAADPSGFLGNPSVEWLFERVSSALRRSTSLQWIRKCVSEKLERRRAVEKFLDGGVTGTKMICFYRNQKEHGDAVLVCAGAVPPHVTKATIFWKKKADIVINEDNAEREIIQEDMSGDTILNMVQVLQHIFLPYMQQSGKGVRWPKVVQQDTCRLTHQFLGAVQHFHGQIKGTTVMPLPPDMQPMRAETSTAGKERERRQVQACESAVMEWVKHIRQEVGQTSVSRLEQMESEGLWPGPLLEIDWWQRRYQNLQTIVTQMADEKVRMCVTMLERVESTYVQGFDTLMEELEEALNEARDVSIHLESLRSISEKFEDTEFETLEALIVPFLHLISLVWFTSRQITPSTVVNLLREVSNVVVNATTEYLNTGDLFDIPPQDAVSRLRTARNLCAKLKDCFFAYRAQVNSQQQTRPWRIDDALVFHRTDAILQRIDDLLDIFWAKVEFSALEGYELGGTRGFTLSQTLAHVSSEFKAAVEDFRDSVMRMGALLKMGKSSIFEKHFICFQEVVRDLDRRLSYAVSTRFNEADTLQQSLGLAESVKGQILRQTVTAETDERAQELLTQFSNELQRVHLQFELERESWSVGGSTVQGPPPTSGEVAGEGRELVFPVLLPNVASMIHWTEGLIMRIHKPMETLVMLNRSLFIGTEGRCVHGRYTLLRDNIRRWRDERLQEWRVHATTVCLERLDQPILQRLSGGGQLVVNFDRELYEVLDGVAALQGFPFELGHNVFSVFQQREEFRVANARLAVVATQYNHIVDTIIPVERPLVKKSLDHINAVLHEGLTELTWRSPRLHDFIARASKAVSTLHGHMIYLKGNINCIVRILRTWKDMWKVIHFNEAESREHRKKSILHELTQMWQGETGAGLSDTEKVAKKWLKRWRDRVSTKIRNVDDVVKQNRRIHRLVENSRELLGVDARSPAWCDYVDHINEIFKQGFLLAVRKSLEHLIRYLEVARSMDAYGHSPDANPAPAVQRKTTAMTLMRGKADSAPLLEVSLNLSRLDDGRCEAAFEPSINRDEFGSVQYRVYEWCHTIFEVGRQLQRLDDPSNHYYALLFDDYDLNRLKDQILRLMQGSVEKLQSVRMDFMRFSYLWVDSVGEFMKRFIRGRLMTVPADDVVRDENVFDESDEEVDEKVEGPESEDMPPVQQTVVPGSSADMVECCVRPTLSDFDGQIRKYQDLRHEIAELPGSISYGWLRVDTNPLKDSLCELAENWRMNFLTHLRDSVIKRLERFKRFVTRTEVGVECDWTSVRNYDDLVKVMKHLAAFFKVCESVDKMFDPLKDTVMLLRKHDVPLPQAVLQDMEDAPVLWRDLKRHCFEVNDMLQPRQLEEVSKIRDLEKAFEEGSVAFYHKRFDPDAMLEHAPGARAPTEFGITPRQAYKSLQELSLLVGEMEKRLDKLRAKQALFQLMQLPARAVTDSRKDLFLLKKLWDVIALITYQLDAWNHVLFKRLNVEDIEARVRKQVLALHGLDKRVRRWNAYAGIEARVKNLLTALPLIQNLRNPAMRPCHWEELMNKTGMRFDLSDHFTLADLLTLSIHEFPDEVTLIVGKASRQQQIEAQINALEAVWKDLSLTFTTPEGAEHPVFLVPEEVQHTIEEHQVVLQSLAQNRFVDVYVGQVQHWQRTLTTVESVLTLFTEVQRTWRHLQSIFVSSDDIRTQLPKESQLFLELDSQVRFLLRDASRMPQIVPMCLAEGREEVLSKMRHELRRCERALEEYLLQKRAAFPRFYFVSVPHLLEILSRSGRNPRSVMEHIPRIMNDLLTLTFDDEEGPDASGGVGRGGETFRFEKQIACAGRVEQWLQRVVDGVASTIRLLLEQAVQSHSEKQREVWLNDNLSQVAFVASQVHWCMDVSACFHAIGEGNETALGDLVHKCEDQLQLFIRLVGGELTAASRRKIMNLATNEVHQRDVVFDLAQKGVDHESAFTWTRQLRHKWDEKTREVRVDICDSQLEYGYEFTGNDLRLVVTPLTERIYITLTQALHLKLGGAPSGPAGTGKTETVKDLAKHIGKPCYVFNCSEQMTSASLSNVFKGLSSSGAWGCFDEFNRIRLEVLSVIAAMYKCILDALRENRKTFRIDASPEVSLDPSSGIFITMNPGYQGRTELPDNLKSLFRPVTVVAPEVGMICENLLLAEGFPNARILSRKFIALFRIAKDLLSKQAHYDWNLRAVKSLLVVAGSLRRSSPELPEEAVLMRALRDYNLPKIVDEDVDSFLGIISDLFTGVNVPRKVDMVFEGAVRKVCLNHGLQPEDGLLLKCSQLHELLSVRHCVFVIGPAAAGKSTCWKRTADAYRALDRRGVEKVINPRSVHTSELFGHVDSLSKEWHDGLVSGVMRSLSEMPESTDGKEHRWLVFDGNVDTEWIESMNSVMDDNKVLTLANNDRIHMTPSMRFLFEVNSLQHATPATVSRAGILYLSLSDIGWFPFVQSWFDRKSMASMVTPMVDKYVQRCLDWVASEGRNVVPMSDFSLVQQLCCLAEHLLARASSHATDDAAHTDKEAEQWFALACIWAFGGCLTTVDGVDTRARFDKWWRQEWKALKFPESGTVFDFCLSTETKKLEKWTERLKRVPQRDCTEVPLRSLMIPTAATVATDFVLDLLLPSGQPIMLVGPAGSGKTLLIRERMRSLPEGVGYLDISLNYFTTHATLQKSLERKLERKMGRRWGPVGKQKLMWVIDDLNMPMVDKYGTQTPIALLRQHLDYGLWYDRAQWQPTYVDGVQYITAMNAAAGSFTINPRFTRHFVCLQLPAPTRDAAVTIFGQVLGQHMQFLTRDVSRVCERLVGATVDVYESVIRDIPKTPVRFHYEVSLRQLAQVFEGLVLSTNQMLSSNPQLTPSVMFVRLWVHEMKRTFHDRLIDEVDRRKFDSILSGVVGSSCSQEGEVAVMLQEPLIFTSFADTDLGSFSEVESMEVLREQLEYKLNEHNEVHPVMDLVLHDSAIEHVARICRVLERPHGHMLLVGVGGSGRQSLARLAAFSCGFTVATTRPGDTGDLQSWRDDLRTMYNRAGVKGENVMLLLADSHVFDERIVVDVNDVLSTGEIAELFPSDDRDEVIRKVRPEVRQAMIVDTADNCWSFFLDKVQRRLHICLCFSPGETFRVRARRFPALVSATVQDWFFPWSVEALESVARRVIEPMELGIEGTHHGEKVRDTVVEFIGSMHGDVALAAAEFNAEEGQDIFVPPKTYLEALHTYQALLSAKLKELDSRRSRLQAGLLQLKRAREDTVSLQEVLGKKQTVAAQKKAGVDDILARLANEKRMLEAESARCERQEAEAKDMHKVVEEKTRECEEDLAKAEPLLIKAQEALDTLNKANLTELKSFKNPPADVQSVLACVCILLSPASAPARDKSWGAALKFMQRVDIFLQALKSYNKENIPASHISQLEPYLRNPGFTGEAVSQKSAAAAGLCEWVRNVVRFYQMHCYVQPKRENVAESRIRLEEMNQRLVRIKAQLGRMRPRYAELAADVARAQEDRDSVVNQAAEMQERLQLSRRLVTALHSEQGRWESEVVELLEKRQVMVGDMLLAAGLVAYAGPFTHKYRKKLLDEAWVPRLMASGIPHTQAGLDPVNSLTTPAQVAVWANQNLPRDNVSVQNACIVTHSRRPILLIDPQFQGMVWMRARDSKDNKERGFLRRSGSLLLGVVEEEATPSPMSPSGSPGPDSPRRARQAAAATETKDKKGRQQVIRHGKHMLDDLESVMLSGNTAIIENLGEAIHPMLTPVLKRETAQIGTREIIRLGEREIEWHPRFQLVLHTKLRSPKYPPEVQAEVTIVNFAVTQQGLEEQLLALVVNKDRADLEQEKQKNIFHTNEYRIRITELEDEVIRQFSSQTGKASADRQLVESLENMTLTSKELAEKAEKAALMDQEINLVRNEYRDVARRGALLFFLLNELEKIEWLYQFSLNAFALLYYRTIDGVEPPRSQAVSFSEDYSVKAQKQLTAERVKSLVQAVTFATFQFVRRGIFERHKLAVALMVCLSILEAAGQLDQRQCDYLLGAHPIIVPKQTPPGTWISDEQWTALRELATLEEFSSIPVDVAGALKRWKEWCDSERPEHDRLPGDWRSLGDLQRLLVVKALRPDRLAAAASDFVASRMGPDYVRQPGTLMSEVFKETSPISPVLFILFPGADPVRDVEQLGRKLGFTKSRGNMHAIAMGEGQGEAAAERIRESARVGGWIVLENVHLMGKWMSTLEAILEETSRRPHAEFRLFLTAEPTVYPENRVPPAIVQSSIKVVTHEPPLGIAPNMMRAWACFNPDQLEASGKPNEYKSLLFALAFFHAATTGRGRLRGWTKHYAFSHEDLIISSQVLRNLLDSSGHDLPWEDMRYILGEIMYGGHITDVWDRRTCMAYLTQIFHEDLFISGQIAPNLICPAPTSYQQYMTFIETSLPEESPTLMGMHPNAEIKYLTDLSRFITDTLRSLRRVGRDADGQSAVSAEDEGHVDMEMADDARRGGGHRAGVLLRAAKRDARMRAMLDDLSQRLPEKFNLAELTPAKGSDSGPLAMFVLQECDRSNTLLSMVHSSLSDCMAGLRGHRTISESMDEVLRSLEEGSVPAAWKAFSFPSLKRLGGWFNDLVMRHAHIDVWSRDFSSMPTCVWLSGFFSPVSFLTAVLQLSARRGGVTIERLKLTTDVIKKGPEDIVHPPREGAYVHGLFLEGARWDPLQGTLAAPELKQLHPPLPVLHVRGVSMGLVPERPVYDCPVYSTTQRGDQYVFTAQLRIPEPSQTEWILKGVCAVMSLDD
eukprot:Hpha_TRINITY_DN15791_c11_g1::TRINITY_DN15791_c11_g1_i1::g.41603::m.41603/K10408/DNAH; dynein heavy chain, axonemal